MKMRALFFVCLTVLLFSRLANVHDYASGKASFTSSLLSDEVLQIVAGPLPGLIADIEVLEVISIFSEMKKYPKPYYGSYIYKKLKNASNLDPMFQDPYRLASSILAFGAKMPVEAILLLEKGTYAIPEKWEIPFLGGFLAYEQLGDSQKAFELMSIAATRQHAPLSTALLAARYLRNESTDEDTILFLKSLLKMIPIAYQVGIQARITELQKHE